MLVDNLTLDSWRHVDAVEVLLAFADYAKQDNSFAPIKDPRTQRWHATVGERELHLVLTGSKFWDEFAGVGGGGAIDLVMHLFNCRYRKAVRLLKCHERNTRAA
jgi:hypothetical protein